MFACLYNLATCVCVDACMYVSGYACQVCMYVLCYVCIYVGRWVYMRLFMYVYIGVLSAYHSS